MRIGYVRVSTVDQSTSRQLDGVQLDKVFEEKVSGATRDREQLELMLQTLRAGDEVFVHELSRLGRSLIDLKQLVQEMTEKGVTVHFVTERMTFTPDGASPTSELMFNLLASFADFERKMLKQRQAEGIAKAKQAGKYIQPEGRKAKLTPEQVRTANDLLSMGKTKSAVAELLKVSRPTLDKALKGLI
jgi:DNA invertase Pin-like site-specific DNA recombinase